MYILGREDKQCNMYTPQEADGKTCNHNMPGKEKEETV